MIIPLLAALIASPAALGQVEDEDCLSCHGDPGIDEFEAEDLASMVEPVEGEAAEEAPEIGRTLFVPEDAFSIGPHEGMSCTDCHMDIEEIPHRGRLEPVSCSECHDDVASKFDESLHGQAVAAADPLAPYCWDCHGKHDIKSASDPDSRTNPINIPQTCGACHAEDAPVARSRNIEQHDILLNYEESLHAEGLLRQGLTVTAVCTSCHYQEGHDILPHTDPASSIHRDNVVGTCTQCHALIEQVHRQVIEGQLWEQQPEVIPICIDCHQPHIARRIFYDEGVSDNDCLMCHRNDVQAADRLLTAVDPAELAGSRHSTVRCAQCHTGVSPNLRRACETVITSVDCSICHAKEVNEHSSSIHGKLLAQGDPDAPVCLDCHSNHGTKSSAISGPNADPSSPTFPRNVPELCGRCHREGQKAAIRHRSEQQAVVTNYAMSIHGKGLLKSGLVVTAMCTDCHTAHSPLPSSDPASTVNPGNIHKTCGRCHYGIDETFLTSIHSPAVTQTDKALPVCSGCHSAHTIQRIDVGDFKLNVMQTCGRCHEEVAETYFDTYHGKVSKLGSGAAAKCHDCHGAHDVLPVTDPSSHLSRRNIVATCAKCHPGSQRRFAGYLTHATHHDPARYPALFYTFWAMTGLLVGTFTFFGAHTLIWIPRSFREMIKWRAASAVETGELMFQRFRPVSRQMHFVLILCFFGLALTGMTLKFSYAPWAVWLSKAFGGIRAAGMIHRVCAVIMSSVFAIHLAAVFQRKRKSGESWKKFMFGPSSLAIHKNDWVEFVQTIKWFLRKGPRPNYGKWTYWEKFDYLAVFWGVLIIGASGIMLWFPEFCTGVFHIPGWFINVAQIIHSDEALLAVGFIFTIHFFNTHFRPEKFPMDITMFTGRMSLEELKRERPRYYEELVASGELKERLVPEVSKEFRFWARIFGTAALAIGFSLVLLIIYSMVIEYR